MADFRRSIFPDEQEIPARARCLHQLTTSCRSIRNIIPYRGVWEFEAPEDARAACPGNQLTTSCALNLETILYEGVWEFQEQDRAPGASCPGKLSTGYPQDTNIMGEFGSLRGPRRTDRGPRAALRISRAPHQGSFGTILGPWTLKTF